MEKALSWKSTNANHPSITTLFCTDSKSFCEALISPNPRTSSIHNSINSILSFIFIEWISGHSAIPDNELADKATTNATNTLLPVSFSSSIKVINETIYDDPPKHECIALIYQHQKASCDSKQSRTKKMTNQLLVYDPATTLLSINIFTVSIHLKIQYVEDATSMNNEQNLNLWLCKCPAVDVIRQLVFGKHKES